MMRFQWIGRARTALNEALFPSSAKAPEYPRRHVDRIDAEKCPGR